MNNSYQELEEKLNTARAEAARYKHELTDVTTHRDQLRGEVAELTRQRDNWEQSAKTFSDGLEFYRGLIRQIGESFGAAARTSDDGSIQQDVLALKVPELVDSLRATVETQAQELNEATTRYEKLRAAVNGMLPRELDHLAELQKQLETQARQTVAKDTLLTRILNESPYEIMRDEVRAALSPGCGNGWVKREDMAPAIERFGKLKFLRVSHPHLWDTSNTAALARAETALNHEGGKTE